MGHQIIETLSKGWNNLDVVRAYFHNSDMQTRWALACLSHFQFKGNERVLDYGSGDGKISAMLSTFVPNGKVLGMDTSHAMTAFASKIYPKSEFPNLTFQSFNDSKEIDTAENFDVITSFCVFQLVPNPREVFAKLFEITKPGGKLVMTFPIGTNPAFTQAAKEVLSARGLTRPPASPDAPAMRNPVQLRQILEEAGYKIEKLEQFHVRYPFSSKEELIDWCEGTLTGNWKIPDEIRREFFEKVVNLYCQYVPEECEEDGFVYFQLDRIDVLAMK